MKKYNREVKEISIAKAATEAKSMSLQTEQKLFLMYKDYNSKIFICDEAESKKLEKGYEPIASYHKGKGMLIRNGVEYSADNAYDERKRVRLEVIKRKEAQLLELEEKMQKANDPNEVEALEKEYNDIYHSM